MAFGTKGMFGVVVVAVALVCYMISTRRLKWLFSWRFLLAAALFFLLITPILYAYYVQFSWEGVRFILWEQVLYRTGGEMYGSASADDYFFFFHSLLWTILPWSLLFYFFAIRDLLKRESNSIYALTVVPSFLIMLMLSFSSFKLPHYLNPLFMLMAIYLATRLMRIEQRTPMLKGVAITQKIVVFIMVLFAILINYYIMPFEQLWFGIVYGVALLWLLFMIFTAWYRIEKVIMVSVAASAIVWIGLNGNFYPQLLRYQAGNEMAVKFKARGLTPKDVAVYESSDASSLDICHGGMHPMVFRNDLVDSTYRFRQKQLWINNDMFDEVMSDSVFRARRPVVVERVPDYRITWMTPQFLNPATRASVIDTVYIVEFRNSLR